MSFKISNAIISCYDKTGLADFAGEIVELNPEAKIFSSSGTFRFLAEHVKTGLVEISDYTGFKEMPSGLVKTLHPKIHSGILADAEDESQRAYLEKNCIEMFDLVVVNLYPFKKVVEEKGDFETARRNIDIGGVSLLESASKNFVRVAPICSNEDYDWVVKEIKEGRFNERSRLRLAKKAFSYLSDYFVSVSDYFSKLDAGDIR